MVHEKELTDEITRERDKLELEIKIKKVSTNSIKQPNAFHTKDG